MSALRSKHGMTSKNEGLHQKEQLAMYSLSPCRIRTGLNGCHLVRRPTERGAKEVGGKERVLTVYDTIYQGRFKRPAESNDQHRETYTRPMHKVQN